MATRSLVLWLVACVACLFVLVGAIYKWHTASGHDSAIVDALWRVVWIGYTFAKVTLIALLLIAAFRYFSKRSGRA
jgi:hypothetical protein